MILILRKILITTMCFITICGLAGCKSEKEFIITDEDYAYFNENVGGSNGFGSPILKENCIELDVTGDGYLDLCAEVWQGSGNVVYFIAVYDVKNGEIYTLKDQEEDYYIDSVKDNQLFVKKLTKPYWNLEPYVLGTLEFEDTEIVFTEIQEN